MESYNKQPVECGCFYLAEYIWDSADAMYLKFIPFLLLSSIPLYGYNIICLSIHQLKTFGLLSTFWWLQIKPPNFRASLVAQWLRIHLPMQGTWVQALVQEDPTCHGAAKPVCHNYWACALEPASHNYWAHVPQLLKPARLEPMLCNKRNHCNEKPVHGNEE